MRFKKDIRRHTYVYRKSTRDVFFDSHSISLCNKFQIPKNTHVNVKLAYEYPKTGCENNISYFSGLGALVYWVCGFAFAYGKVSYEEDGKWRYSDANAFIGHHQFFLMDPTYTGHKVEGYPERVVHGGSIYGEFFFNFVFAATATTIISGALAERVEFGAYLIYGVLATGFIQPVTVHWAWSNGWLVYPPASANLPPNVWYRDYAGGGNVHAVGGAAALVGCLFIGPRVGRFEVSQN